MSTTVKVIGGGLAGCEAAWQLAKRGIKVELYEMKPKKFSPAHSNPDLCEIVCSNSFKSNALTSAPGLLKEELRRLGSIVLECADKTRVPAGDALAVDRDEFSRLVTKRLMENPNVTIIREEVAEITEDTIVATGPLTQGALLESIKELCGGDYLYFYDAASPIVSSDSIDMNKAFRAARYGKGGADYINCPMNKDEYERFYEALISAETVPLDEGIDNPKVFEGCMPIEIMARRGKDTLLFGPLKPVGLAHPETGKEYYAVVQLRQDNAAGTLYNLVGFQTNLKWGEQKRVFRMIPGLENAEFMRYGVMHRNTYINSPSLLDATYALRGSRSIFFAGQITGVEGYVESAASGLVAGINMARLKTGKDKFIFPPYTAVGALAHYISNASIGDFQPMNINFGIIEPLGEKIRQKKERYKKIAERALEFYGENATF